MTTPIPPGQSPSTLSGAVENLIASRRFQKSPAATKLISYLLAETLNEDAAITPYDIHAPGLIELFMDGLG